MNLHQSLNLSQPHHREQMDTFLAYRHDRDPNVMNSTYEIHAAHTRTLMRMHTLKFPSNLTAHLAHAIPRHLVLPRHTM